MKTQYLDRQLTLMLQSDDERQRKAAMSQIYLTNRISVLKILSSKIYDEEDRKDIVSRAFETAFMKIMKGEFVEQSSIRNYVIGIAKKLVFKHYEKKKRSNLYKETIITGPEVVLTHDEEEYIDKQWVNTMMGQLCDKCRQLLRLWMQSYSFKEIAAKLSYKSENSAKVSKFKCMKKLTKIVAKYHQSLKTEQHVNC